MIASILSQELRARDMPFVDHSERGLAWKVYERLWLLAKERLSIEALEQFIIDKLEAAQSNLDRLEDMQFPAVAAGHQVRLQTAFATYETALVELAGFLETSSQAEQASNDNAPPADSVENVDNGDEEQAEFYEDEAIDFDPEPALSLADTIRLLQLADAEVETFEAQLEQQIEYNPVFHQAW